MDELEVEEHIKKCDVEDCVKPVFQQVCSEHSINPDFAEQISGFHKCVVFGVNIGSLTTISVVDDDGTVGHFAVDMINQEKEAWEYTKGIIDKYFDRFNLR